jgi:endonuclease/exonuclease/phosphatase family metal-dependent hydrolase
VASFNLHAGVDGLGRPFDVVQACRTIDADVLALQETWAPAGGRALAEEVGAALGYTVVEHALAAGRRAQTDPLAREPRAMVSALTRRRFAFLLDTELPAPRRVARAPGYRSARSGTWGIALLSRVPIVRTRLIDFGRLPRDPARRAALAVTLECSGRRVVVVGTHMSHILYASHRHFVQLSQALDEALGDAGGSGVLLGDMNMWGPAVNRFFPHWRRAVRGATWPSWWPHSQLDHVLVSPEVGVLHGEVVRVGGSDHLPIRARLALP